MFKLSVISPAATYALTSNVTTAAEGSQIVITLNTTGVQHGQALPYVISGNGITVDDFTNISSLSGNMVVYGGVATLVLMTKADVAYEGTETVTVTLVDRQISIDVGITNVVLGTIFDSGETIFDNGETYWDVAP